MVVIIERYASRTDTKEVIQQRNRLKPGTGNDQKTQKSFFTQDEIFKKANTMRSMTVRLKTMKTGDIDLNNQSVQNFLTNLQGGDDTQSLSDDKDKVYVTKQ